MPGPTCVTSDGTNDWDARRASWLNALTTHYHQSSYNLNGVPTSGNPNPDGFSRTLLI